MGVITTGSFAKDLFPLVGKWYGDAYPEYKPEYTQVFEMGTSKGKYVEEVGFVGTGLAPIKAEGMGIAYDSMEQGYITRYTNVTYGLGFIITREAYDDAIWDGQAKNKAAQLKWSQRHTKETVHANIFNRAFSGSYVYGDGVEMCATNHPNKSGGTWANELATAADLSEASLEQACIDIGAFTNDRGGLIGVQAMKLIIPPALEFEAARILKSIQQSGGANNDINAIRVLGKFPGGVVVIHRLTDADAWFIQTDCPNGLKSFTRRAPEFNTENDFDTENARFKYTERYVCGMTDPRGIFGSPGC